MTDAEKLAKALEHQKLIEEQLQGMAEERRAALTALGGFAKPPFDESVVEGIRMISARCASAEKQLAEQPPTPKADHLAAARLEHEQQNVKRLTELVGLQERQIADMNELIKLYRKQCDDLQTHVGTIGQAIKKALFK